MSSSKHPDIYTRVPGRPSEVRMLSTDLHDEHDGPTFRSLKATLARDYGLEEAKNVVLELTGINGRFLGEERALIVSTHEEWRKMWCRLKGTEKVIVTFREAPRKLTQEELRCADETADRLEAVTQERDELQALTKSQALKLVQLDAVMQERNSLKALANDQASRILLLEASEKKLMQTKESLKKEAAASQSALLSARYELTYDRSRLGLALNNAEEARSYAAIELAELRARLQDSATKLSDATRDRSRLGLALKDAEEARSYAARELAKLRARLQDSATKLSDLRRKHDRQGEELAQLRATSGCSIQ